MAGAIVSSAMTRPALPRLPRSTSKALQAARNRAAAILSTCKLCADITDEALNNEVGIATPDREARKRGPAPSNEGWRQAVREARSLAGEAGKYAESQPGDQDAGRAGNRCRVLDQREEEALVGQIAVRDVERRINLAVIDSLLALRYARPVCSR